MSEFIMGLGVSVKICKLYEELVYLTFSNSDMTEEFFDNVETLKTLIEYETDTYDSLDYDEIDKYLKIISKEDLKTFDAVKNRYYSKLRERKNLMDSGQLYEYPFSLNTAIVGKILLEALVNIEKQFLNIQKENDNGNDEESMFNLYSFHRTYKYTLISMNDFLEGLAVDFNFQLCDIPVITFDKIKTNFRCNDKFYKYLNNLLIILAKDIIKLLVKDTGNNMDVNSIYNSVLAISQLEVIISYLDKNSINKLIDYCNTVGINNSLNSKHIDNLIKKRVKTFGDNNG